MEGNSARQLSRFFKSILIERDNKNSSRLEWKRFKRFLARKYNTESFNYRSKHTVKTTVGALGISDYEWHIRPGLSVYSREVSHM